MSDRTARSIADYDIRLAEDQLTAAVRIEAGGSIDPAHLVDQLTRTGIKCIDHTAIATAAVDLAKPAEASEATDGLTLIVARGEPAVEDVPERLTRIEPPAPAEPPENHYERVRLVTVNPGEAVATITPAVVGRDGLDVFGRPILRKRLAKPVAAGEGATRDSDLMIAQRAGRVKIEAGRLDIEPRLDIAGDVSFATGNVRFDGDICIGGSVLDLFVVNSTADVHVGGAIEAAHVSARGEVTVDGGIAGKDKGQVSAGASVQCRYISNAQVHAHDRIEVHGEVANSRIVCGGALVVETGPIFASHVTANGGVECRSLGNTAFAKTVISVGDDPDLKRLAGELLPQLHRCLHEAQHMKDIVQPLLRDPKRLTEQQREQATQLLYHVAKTDGELALKLEAFRSAFRFSQERFKPEITVEENLYPGVTIRLPGMEATVTALFTGPLKIAESRGGRRKAISVLNLESGAAFTLITHITPRDQCADLREILGLAA